MLIFLIIILLVVIFSKRKECLISKPNKDMISSMANEIVENEGMFSGGLESVKKKIKWMDPITYEDVRKLHFSKKLNHKTIRDILNG